MRTEADRARVFSAIFSPEHGVEAVTGQVHLTPNTLAVGDFKLVRRRGGGTAAECGGTAAECGGCLVSPRGLFRTMGLVVAGCLARAWPVLLTRPSQVKNDEYVSGCKYYYKHFPGRKNCAVSWCAASLP